MRVSRCLVSAMLVLLLSTLVLSESFAQSMAGRKEVTLHCWQSVLTEEGYVHDEFKDKQIWDIEFIESYQWYSLGGAAAAFHIYVYDLNGILLGQGSSMEHASVGGGFFSGSLYGDCIRLMFLNTDDDPILGTYQTSGDWNRGKYCQAVTPLPSIHGADIAAAFCDVKLRPERVKK